MRDFAGARAMTRIVTSHAAAIAIAQDRYLSGGHRWFHECQGQRLSRQRSKRADAGESSGAGEHYRSGCCQPEQGAEYPGEASVTNGSERVTIARNTFPDGRVLRGTCAVSAEITGAIPT